MIVYTLKNVSANGYTPFWYLRLAAVAASKLLRGNCFVEIVQYDLELPAGTILDLKPPTADFAAPDGTIARHLLGSKPKFGTVLARVADVASQ